MTHNVISRLREVSSLIKQIQMRGLYFRRREQAADIVSVEAPKNAIFNSPCIFNGTVELRRKDLGGRLFQQGYFVNLNIPVVIEPNKVITGCCLAAIFVFA
jgi:hypothetical protein